MTNTFVRLVMQTNNGNNDDQQQSWSNGTLHYTIPVSQVSVLKLRCVQTSGQCIEVIEYYGLSQLALMGFDIATGLVGVFD